MIVTFDTAILVRATERASGPARRAVLAIAEHPDHELALSEYIVGEVGKVLSYARIQERFNIGREDVYAHLVFLSSISRIVAPATGLPVVLSDPKDDPVIYTAVAARADILCANDRHFFDPNVTRFCAARGIRVMDDVALLDLLRS